MINLDKLREYKREQEELKEVVAEVAPLVEQYVHNLDGEGYYTETITIGKMIADSIEDQLRLYKALEHHWRSKGYSIEVIKEENNRTAKIEKIGNKKP